MKKIVALIFGIFILSQNLFADEQTVLKEKFLSKIDEVIQIVAQKDIDKKLRNDMIVKSVTPMFDFELMAKLSLGKKWKSLDSQKREKFVDIYVKRMQNSYSSKLDAYSNEKVEVSKIKQPKKSRLILITNLVSNSNKLEIIYKYYKPKRLKMDKNTWLIYDVEILGISILKTDKAQFREFLKTKTIEQLMEKM